MNSEFERALGSGGVVLIGGGGHSLVVAEAAEGVGLTVVGCVDDHPKPVLVSGAFAKPYFGPVSAVPELGPSCRFVLAFGSLEARERVLRSGIVPLDRFVTICHAGACVSRSAVIGSGTFVGPRAVINARALIGEHAIINTGAVVEHECRVEPNVHVAPSATLGGRCEVGTGTLIGIGARVIPGIRIGEGAVIGAGAVVIRDVPAGAKVVGCPARAM